MEAEWIPALMRCVYYFIQMYIRLYSGWRVLVGYFASTTVPFQARESPVGPSCRSETSAPVMS